MRSILDSTVVINALLFQALWFACVVGGANLLMWPAIIAGAVMAIWQLHPKRRHHNDISVVLAALILGLLVDSSWTIFGLMEFAGPRPMQPLAPGWILIMWMGFALTVNHSMAWLANHPVLPGLMGLIGGPLAYFAGLRLGAVQYLIDPWHLSAILGIVWAIALTILVKIGQLGKAESSKLSAY